MFNNSITGYYRLATINVQSWQMVIGGVICIINNNRPKVSLRDVIYFDSKCIFWPTELDTTVLQIRPFCE
jgi:hypothetical protein